MSTNRCYIRAHRYRSPHLLAGSSESCLPWQNDSKGIISEFPVCHRIHNVIACNKADRGTIPIHLSTNMLTLDALHREAGIELIEALSSSNGATTNIYEIANCKLATFQNDARRTTHIGEVEAQTRRAYQELLLEQTVACNDLFTLRIQDTRECGVFEVSKDEERSAFHNLVFALGHLS
mgnify:CR=1 FL=1